jgi:pimeloyl-ACP methyl ester carboxylesterase
MYFMSQTVINLAHANGFPAGSYHTFMQCFSSNYRFIAKDKYAHNPRFPIHSNWQYLVDELLEFIDDQPEPIVGLGHSFGGVITFFAACKAPEKFKGIIMLDPPIFVGTASLLIKLIKKTPLIDKISPAGKAQIRRSHWPLNADVYQHFARSALFRHFDKRCLHDYVNSAIKQHPEGLTLDFLPQVEADIFRNLPSNISDFKGQLTIPAAFIRGEHSTVTKPKVIEQFCQQHCTMKMYTLADAGHMFPLEKPEQSAQLIEQIIQSW